MKTKTKILLSVGIVVIIACNIALQLMISNLSSDIKQAKNEILEVRSDIDEVQIENESYDNQILSVQKDFEKRTSINANQIEQIETAKTTIAEYELELVNLNTSLEEKQTYKEEQELDIAELQSEIARLEAKAKAAQQTSNVSATTSSATNKTSSKGYSYAINSAGQTVLNDTRRQQIYDVAYKYYYPGGKVYQGEYDSVRSGLHFSQGDEIDAILGQALQDAYNDTPKLETYSETFSNGKTFTVTRTGIYGDDGEYVFLNNKPGNIGIRYSDGSIRYNLLANP